MRTTLAAFVAAVVTVLCATVAWGQTPAEILHAFAGDTFPVRMDLPGNLLQASDGNFYGLTTWGSSDPRYRSGQGAIFRMTPGGTVTVIYGFTGGVGGSEPRFLLQATDGNLYGIARGMRGVGGPFYSFVFRLTLAGDLRIVHAFPDGMSIGWLLQASDGNFYVSSDYAILRMTPDGVVSSAGSGSGALMQGRDGNFYGVGDSGVFKLTLAGTYTQLHSFPYANDTFYPHPLVQAGDGNLYGATTYAGDNPNGGEIFRVSPSGDWTVLHMFTGGADGDTPWAGLTVGPDGNLYGTTSHGGPFGKGVIFRVTLLNDGFSVVHGFTGGADGASPANWPGGELLSATDGNLYGTTSSGAFGFGTFFRMSLDETVTTLNAIKAGPDGAYPQAPLLQASDGNFYGTTPRGGSYDRGVLFRMSGSGAMTILHEFSGGLDGGSPTSTPIEGPDGYLYGTAPQNGQFDAGVVFRVACTTGAFETLHAFAGSDGAHPYAALLLARDGRFYGTTSSGGTSGHGTVFTMNAGGDVTVLHSFAGDADGAEPVAPLIQAADGLLYGTASTDGRFYNPYDGPCPALYGTTFRISTAGSFRTLHVFDGSAGGHPTQALLQARDGTFYGTTQGRCTVGGTIFSMTSDGAVKILQPFASTSLIQATDGKLYGAGSVGSWWGAVFQIRPDGAVRIVTGFSGGDDGAFPSGLMQGRDGKLYGASYSGGVYQLGVLFRIDLHLDEVPKPPAIVTASAPGGVPVRLAWSDVPNAATFTIKRSLASGQETVLARNVLDTVFVDRSASIGQRYYYVVTAVNTLGESVASYEVAVSPGRATPGDYDGDGKADATVFRPSNGVWYIRQSATLTAAAHQWASAGDIPVPGDYDGDGKIDIAVFRPSNGVWYIRQSSTLTMASYQWASAGDIPVPGDYDGDGKTDAAVFRPSTGMWYIRQSSTLTMAAHQWASAGDVPVPGDYDGDGKTDIAVFRPATGTWYVRQSRTLTMGTFLFGIGTDVLVPADYDGDGKTDIAVFRPSTGEWYIASSSTHAVDVRQWASADDIPVPGDYDGDGRADIAVFRPSWGQWWTLNSIGTSEFPWGIATDLPLPSRP